MNKVMNRRKWLATAGLAALSGCARNKGSGFDGYALVANAGDNSLAAIDLTGFRLTATIPLAGAPTKLVSAQPAAYALTSENGTIHTIGRDRKVARSRRLADHLSDLHLSGDGNSLLALSSHANELIQVGLANLEPLARYKFSVRADTVEFSSNGFAAAASRSGSIELLHLASGERTRTQTPALGEVRFRSDGKVLLVANLQNRSLLALDVPSLRAVAELPLAMQPDHLCFNSDQGQLFVSGTGMDGVAVVFPFHSLVVDQTLLAGRDPGAMACSASPAYLFVASRTVPDICILNVDTRKVVGFVELGGRPSFITVTPDSKYALVLDQDAGSMGVIRVPASLSAEAKRLKTGASLFTMISVGNKPVDAIVIPRLA